MTREMRPDASPLFAGRGSPISWGATTPARQTTFEKKKGGDCAAPPPFSVILRPKGRRIRFPRPLHAALKGTVGSGFFAALRMTRVRPDASPLFTGRGFPDAPQQKNGPPSEWKGDRFTYCTDALVFTQRPAWPWRLRWPSLELQEGHFPFEPRLKWGPFQNFTCSAEVNSACAKVLALWSKTLVRRRRAAPAPPGPPRKPLRET